MSTLKEKAQDLLAARLTALDGIEESQAVLIRVRQELTDAETAAAKAWEGALSAGWTPQELRALGLAEPTSRRRPGRPRGTTRARRTSAASLSPTTPQSEILGLDQAATDAT